jgi:uncharacterized protein YxjI
VTGKIMALGDKLYFNDMEGNNLIYIEQKLWRLLAEYNMFENDEKIATVKRKFSFRPRFDITSKFGEITLDGNYWQHEFSIKRENYTMADVSKKWFSLSDTYGIEVYDTENTEFILALAIVIDQVLHDNAR